MDKPVDEDSNIEQINNNITNSDDYVVLDEDKTYETEEPAQEPKETEKIEKKTEEKIVEKKAVEKKVEKKVVEKPKIQPIKKEVKEQPKIHKKIIHKKIIIKKKSSLNSEKNKMPKHKKKSKMLWLWIIIIIALAAALIILLVNTKDKSPGDTKISSEIAATVNNEPIYAADIDQQYNSLNPLQQSFITKETLLNQSIDEILLLQEAKKQNIKVSAESVKKEIDALQKQSQLSDADFEKVLAEQNITKESLQLLIEKKLRIRSLINDTILKTISITDDKIKEYYEDNKEEFTTPEKVKVSHILVMITDNVTDDAAKKKAENISKMLNSTNFCELAKKYSDDTGSKDSCGEYTFGKGEMVKEFEDASFAMKVGDVLTVKTIYGYHIIKKLDKIAAETKELSDVKENVKSMLYDKEAQEKFEAMLKDLRDNAIIVNYMFRQNQNVTLVEIPLEEDKEELVEETVNETEPVKNESTETVKETEVKTETIVEVSDEFGKCLQSKGVTFYGASWCNACKENMDSFGDAFNAIKYVDCADPENPQVQTEECNKAGIKGYPTWKIGDTSFQGELTVEKLSKLTGCTQ